MTYSYVTTSFCWKVFYSSSNSALHICNPSTWEMEEEEAILSYIVSLGHESMFKNKQTIGGMNELIFSSETETETETLTLTLQY